MNGHPRRWSRRAWLGAGLAAPIAAAALVGPRVRGALLGTAPLSDGRIALPPSGGFPRTLLGPVGDRWTLAAPPRRVVSTYLAADEILAALMPPARMAAVSVFADDPVVSNVAGLYPPGVARVRAQIEAILSLAPDLVCVAGYSDADGLRLEIGAGLPVLRWSRFATFDDVLANVRLLGAAVGADASAEALAAGVERRLAALRARLAGVTPVRALYLDPPDFSAGAGTLIDEMLSRGGAVNVARQAQLDGAGPIPVETALALDPDVLVMPAAPGGPAPLATVRSAPLWRELRAARSGAVVELPAAWTGDVSHHAARAPAAIAQALHPSRFG
ncbi:MAG: ABC transporter substrate-binding protein [Verrucomicrobiota bacterium]